MENKYIVKYARFITPVLIAAILNFSIVPSSFSAGRLKRYPFDNLAVRLMSKPITDEAIRKQGELGVLVMHAVDKDPSVVTSKKGDMISGNNIVHFSQARKVVLKGPHGEASSMDIFVIPCSGGKDLYYAYMYPSGKAHPGMNVVTAEHHLRWCQDLLEVERISSEEVERVGSEIASNVTRENGAVRYFSVSDENVRLVRAFLDRVGLISIKERLDSIIEAKKLMFYEGPVMSSEGVIVISGTERGSEKARAILARLLADKGIVHPVSSKFESVFNEFRENERGFDLTDSYPELAIFVRELEGDNAEGANEGSIKFDREKAAEFMIDVSSIDIQKCERTVEDIKRIFRDVSSHIMYEHNKRVWDDRYKATRSVMPGMDPEDIVVEKISDCLLPTARIKRDGKIKIALNENFVKLMYKWKKVGLRSKPGKIYDYPPFSAPQTLRNIYDSIIYSIAFHEIKGHFRINEWGFPVFNPDEFYAQGERGGSEYLYTNTLAMMFFWLVGVERAHHPVARARLFIKENPHLFRNLSAEEKEKLPIHLMDLIFGLTFRHRVKLYGLKEIKETWMKWPEVRDLIDHANDEIQKEAVAYPEERSILEASPAAVLEVMYAQAHPMTEKEVAEKLGVDDHSMVSWSLDVLTNMDILKRATGEAGSVYEVIPVVNDEARDIQRSLRENGIVAFSEIADIANTRAQVYRTTQRRWVHILMDLIYRNRHINEIRAKGQKALLVLETDWIPDKHRIYIQELVQEIKELEGTGLIEVVRASSGNLGSSVSEKIKELEAKGMAKEDILGNMVVLAGKDTIDTDEFVKSIRGKAFVAGVDPGNLQSDSFIRLVEMISMAMRSAFEGKLLFQHPNIDVSFIEEDGGRTVVFIPRAEKVNPEKMKKIYDIQKRLISAA